ncbi:MAG: phosphomannomutase/phosphoglucomutase [Pseudomonadota bacterium]|nr:phosphomannomutase/phosphoglucomutase [Pseudomonadota bacterium]
MFNLDSDILRAYDIRGVVGQSLSADVAFAVGRAFATIARDRLGRQPMFCSAYDGRLSSPELEQALVDGMVASGADVVRLGLGPTPMLYFGVNTEKRDGGIMVTGSHNPPEYNGFKLMLGRLPFWDDDIKVLGQVAQSGSFSSAHGEYREISIERKYVDRLCLEYDSDLPYSVVWDCGNGAAGGVVRALTDRLPGQHVVLNELIDGTFPSHHPDPTVAANLEQLIDTVKSKGADLGVAFDGDGDRIGVVDHQGTIVWGDQLLTIYARDLLMDSPGEAIIADVKSSSVFFDEVKRCGGEPIMWRTGHSPIKKKMAELSAPLAGEMSGHIFFADRYYGYDDALYAAVRLLGILAKSHTSLFNLRESLPKTISTPEIRFPCDDSQKFRLVKQVLKSAHEIPGADVNELDGVRVTTADGWWLLRASNTQPVLVVRFESWSDDGMMRLKDTLSELLAKIGIDHSIVASG